MKMLNKKLVVLTVCAVFLVLYNLFFQYIYDFARSNLLLWMILRPFFIVTVVLAVSALTILFLDFTGRHV